jgi:hypothetical protein
LSRKKLIQTITAFEMDISFLVLLATIFIGRFVQMNAFKNLSDADKTKVLSKNIMQVSQVSLFITFGMVLVFYLLMSQYSGQYKPISIIFLGAILLLRIITFSIARKNMMVNAIPDDYMKRYFLSWLITTIGVVLFMFLMIKQYF